MNVSLVTKEWLSTRNLFEGYSVIGFTSIDDDYR